MSEERLKALAREAFQCRVRRNWSERGGETTGVSIEDYLKLWDRWPQTAQWVSWPQEVGDVLRALGFPPGVIPEPGVIGKVVQALRFIGSCEHLMPKHDRAVKEALRALGAEGE